MSWELLYSLRVIQRAVDDMVREDYYGPEDAQKRIAELLVGMGEASIPGGSITLYQCPDCSRYADPEVVQDNACALAGHGRPVKVQAFVCGVCRGRDRGDTDGPSGQRLPLVCGACAGMPVAESVGHRRPA